jgi:hypothetical protein
MEPSAGNAPASLRYEGSAQLLREGMVGRHGLARERRAPALPPGKSRGFTGKVCDPRILKWSQSPVLHRAGCAYETRLDTGPTAKSVIQ